MSAAVHAQAFALACSADCGGTIPIVCRCGTTCWPAPRWMTAAAGAAPLCSAVAAENSGEGPRCDPPPADSAADASSGVPDGSSEIAAEVPSPVLPGRVWTLRLSNRYQALDSTYDETPSLESADAAVGPEAEALDDGGGVARSAASLGAPGGVSDRTSRAAAARRCSRTPTAGGAVSPAASRLSRGEFSGHARDATLRNRADTPSVSDCDRRLKLCPIRHPASWIHASSDPSARS